MLKRLVIFIFLLSSPGLVHGKNLVTGLRVSENNEYSRIVFDLTNEPNYKLFTLKSPSRLVVDITNAKWDSLQEPKTSNQRIASIRHSSNSNNSLRVVFDIIQPVDIKKDFILKPSANSSHRLVVDIVPKNLDLDAFALAYIPQPVAKQVQDESTPKPVLKKRRKPLIVIDAGHGGHDPGTIGRRGTKEKTITLKYSKALRKALLSTNRYKVYMTRSNDTYIKLNDRVKKARNAKGDLFISIHANSHKNKKTQGLSVYTLSEKASDKEAAALARKENKAGIIDGINLESQFDELAALFIDMTQRNTKNLSASFAETLVIKSKNKAKLLRNPHRFAGFRVLTGADIPSVLIELGYLSNRREEKLLKKEKYKKKLANAIVEAIDTHFNKYKIE